MAKKHILFNIYSLFLSFSFWSITEDEDFVESNLMSGINGYVFGNLPDLDFCQADRVAWHVFSLGTETDMHTLYFHGNVLVRLQFQILIQVS